MSMKPYVPQIIPSHLLNAFPAQQWPRQGEKYISLVSIDTIHGICFFASKSGAFDTDSNSTATLWLTRVMMCWSSSSIPYLLIMSHSDWMNQDPLIVFLHEQQPVDRGVTEQRQSQENFFFKGKHKAHNVTSFLHVDLVLWRRRKGSRLPQGSWWIDHRCRFPRLYPDQCLGMPAQRGTSSVKAIDTSLPFIEQVRKSI